MLSELQWQTQAAKQLEGPFPFSTLTVMVRQQELHSQKILAVWHGSPVAALMLTFNLCYEEPTVAESEKSRGACGVGTFIKHRRPPRLHKAA
jgi:hypothetical protein